MNEEPNVDKLHQNLLNIWIFDEWGNLLGFGETSQKNTVPKLQVASSRAL
jgi:hypothetical protein